MNISVYLTSYNQKEYLREAIDSVLAQTLQPGQIIVVDDASTDGSQELIKTYYAEYPRLFTPIFHDANQGVAQTRVDALRAVTGDFVTYLDGDDRYLPQKLEKEGALLQGCSNACIACSNQYYMTADGRRTGTWVTDKLPPQGEIFVPTLTRQFPRGNLFRMELLPYKIWQEAGFYDLSLDILEDWEMRIRLTQRARLVYLDEPLAEIRVHRGGLSSGDAAARLRAFDAIWSKHQPVVEELDPAQQQVVTQRMKRLRARFERQQAKELLGAYASSAQVDKRQALRLYQHSWADHRALDLDLLAGVILPSDWYLALRQRLRRIAGQGDGR